MTKQTLLSLLGGAFFAALLAAMPMAEPREAAPALRAATLQLVEESPEACWEPDDQPVDPMSAVLRVIIDCHEELALSDAQMDRLDDLADAFFRETTERQGALRSAQVALVEIMRPNPGDPAGPADAGAAEARMREIAQLQLEQDIALLRVLEATKAVLEPSQRGRLATLMGGIGTSRPTVPQQSL